MASHLASKLLMHRQSVFHLRKQRNVKRLQYATQKAKVVDFLKQPHVSTPLPGKSYILKNNIQKYSLNDTITNLYQLFLDENPDCKMSRATFARQRPHWMITIVQASRRQCLCLYHQNSVLKLQACKIKLSPDRYLRENTDEEIQDQLEEDLPDEDISYTEWQKQKVNYGDSVITKV